MIHFAHHMQYESIFWAKDIGQTLVLLRNILGAICFYLMLHSTFYMHNFVHHHFWLSPLQDSSSICLLSQNGMEDNEGERAHSLYKVMFQSTIFRAYVSIWDKKIMDLKYFSICKSMDTLGV